MTAHWGILLDWTVADFAVLGIAIQQYVSISRDIKRSKAKEVTERATFDTNKTNDQDELK